MAVTARIQNFQSIEDATIVIDGLTVITGTNNSGKTAVMRAIRGVFTNAPPGPLVRHGCAHLSVTLTFDDGTVILWEKGWEKPNRKGKTVNRYTINGKQIATVGRGVPPEVEALGVREIQAASDRVWPQIADQFDGTLFLVNRPGSAVAEALSDVERVGKLTSALKASEKDRRAVNAELKVRRKDVTAHKQEVDRFDGLDGVADQIRDLKDAREALQSSQSEVEQVTDYRDRYQSASASLESLEGFDPAVVPDSQRVTKLSSWSRKLDVLNTYRERYQRAVADFGSLEGFDPAVVPDSQRVEKLRRVVSVVTDFRGQRQRAQERVDALDGFSAASLPDSAEVVAQRDHLNEVQVYITRRQQALGETQHFDGFVSQDLPSTEGLDKIRGEIDTVNSLWERFNAAHEAVDAVAVDATRVSGELAEAEAEVKRLLGDRGVCPTCNTIHDGVHV
jgi:DNA repair exonuclease SbcCD ATPase subunit